MEYTFVSGDSHMDMSWLPGDMFTSAAPASLRDQMPHVEDAPTKETKYGLYSKIWVCEGKELGVFGSMGMGFAPPQPGMSHRNDRMQEAGYYEGGPHPSTPDLRIRDQDMDGVQAEVLLRPHPLRPGDRGPGGAGRDLPHLQRVGDRLLQQLSGALLRPGLRPPARPHRRRRRSCTRPRAWARCGAASSSSTTGRTPSTPATATGTRCGVPSPRRGCRSRSTWAAAAFP